MAVQRCRYAGKKHIWVSAHVTRSACCLRCVSAVLFHRVTTYAQDMGKAEPFYRWCVDRPEEFEKCQMLAINSAMIENVGGKSRGVASLCFCFVF